MNQIEQPVIPESEMKLPTQATGQLGITADPKIVIAVLVFALVVISVGLFLWYKASLLVTPVAGITPTRPTAEMNNEPESTTAKARAGSYGVMSTSDEISAIEADLESTNLDSLGSELIQIEAELKAAI